MNQAYRVKPLFLASCISTWIGISALLISPVVGQVNGSGPSPSSDFDVVFNLPEDPFDVDLIDGIVAEDGQTIQVNSSGFFGGLELPFTAQNGVEVNISDGIVGFSLGGLLVADSGSEVNLSGGLLDGDLFALFGSEVNISGGELDGSLDAFFGSLVNISGGIFNRPFQSLNAYSGSEVSVSGGILGDGFDFNSGSFATISGGVFGSDFSASQGSDVELVGGDFRLNGVDFTGNTITLADGDIFTGTLSDGSPFLFDEGDGDTLAEVTLTTAPLPPLDLDPIVVNGSSGSAPFGLRTGQTLILQEGGSLLRNFTAIDATVNIEGGALGSGVEALGGEVNVSGGSVGSGFHAYSGSEVNISGGVVGSSFDAFSGSEINISGGTVGSSFDAFSGSVVNISGGVVGRSFDALSGSEVTIGGGAFGDDFFLSSDSDAEFVGGEFRLNGADFSGDTISLADGDVFTGTFADGSSFIFSDASDRLDSVTLTAAALPTVDLAPTVIDTPVVSGPSGLRAGQSLTVTNGGALREGFAVVDATLSIEEDGVVDDGLDAYNSVVSISGGTVGRDFSVFESVVTISGGEIETEFSAFNSEVNISDGVVDDISANSGSIVNISGGNVANDFAGDIKANFGSIVNISGGNMLGETFSSLCAGSGSVVNISGGNLGGGDSSRIEADFGSEVNLSGGLVISEFAAASGSHVNFVGSSFVLDGQPFDESLTAGTPFTILDRDVTLSGLLADGSPFSFNLNANSFFAAGDTFDPEAILTVTLVSDVLLGDANQDDEVTFADIPEFIAILQSGTFLEEADVNQDGEVNFSDIVPFIEVLMSN